MDDFALSLNAVKTLQNAMKHTFPFGICYNDKSAYKNYSFCISVRITFVKSEETKEKNYKDVENYLVVTSDVPQPGCVEFPSNEETFIMREYYSSRETQPKLWDSKFAAECAYKFYSLKEMKEIIKEASWYVFMKHALQNVRTTVAGKFNFVDQIMKISDEAGNTINMNEYVKRYVELIVEPEKNGSGIEMLKVREIHMKIENKEYVFDVCNMYLEIESKEMSWVLQALLIFNEYTIKMYQSHNQLGRVPTFENSFLSNIKIIPSSNDRAEGTMALFLVFVDLWRISHGFLSRSLQKSIKSFTNGKEGQTDLATGVKSWNAGESLTLILDLPAVKKDQSNFQCFILDPSVSKHSLQSWECLRNSLLTNNKSLEKYKPYSERLTNLFTDSALNPKTMDKGKGSQELDVHSKTNKISCADANILKIKKSFRKSMFNTGLILIAIIVVVVFYSVFCDPKCRQQV